MQTGKIFLGTKNQIIYFARKRTKKKVKRLNLAKFPVLICPNKINYLSKENQLFSEKINKSLLIFLKERNV